MASALAFFPCDSFLADLFCRFLVESHVADRVDALVLEKQRGLMERLGDGGFHHIWTVDEPLYGAVEREETRDTFRRIVERRYDLALFPQNMFKGNGFLLGSVLARTVQAVNVSHESGEYDVISIDSFVPLEGSRPHWAQEILRDVQEKLRVFQSRLEELNRSAPGERPTSGLVTGDPLSIEEYIRYQEAAVLARDEGLSRIVDFGSGLGFGAYTLAASTQSVVLGLEIDQACVDLARQAWEPMVPQGRLRFGPIDPEALLPPESADLIVCLEVLEHMEDPEDALARFQRALRPGGVLFASTPEPKDFPYRVNTERQDRGADKLRREGIWKWHVSGLTAKQAREAALAAGFSGFELRYPTYLTGQRLLARIIEASSTDQAIDTLCEALPWRMEDFILADVRCPVFSGFSYVFIARK